MRRYEVAVIGLGAMGSAVLAYCAQRGLRCAGFEQFERGHDRGSSSGRSRLIRKAYYEHPGYVPLLLRAYDLWQALERERGVSLLQITGLLTIGDPNAGVLYGARSSAREHALPVQELDAAHVRRRFPMFAIRDDEAALYEPDGGYVVPEAAIAAFLAQAQAHGAQMQFGSRMTIDRALMLAERVVVCAGAWLPQLDGLVPIAPERAVQHWFAARDARFAQGNSPAFLIDRKEWDAPLYGFPDYGYGIKAAFHGGERFDSADALDRSVRESDVASVRAALENALPGAAGAYAGGKVCMYATTPDRHFAISAHPREQRVILAGGFSGHGFKFAPVIGEAVAHLVSETPPPVDIAFLSAGRF